MKRTTPAATQQDTNRRPGSETTTNRAQRRHPEKRLLDYEEAGAVLGCTGRMVRKLAETRQIDTVAVGRLIRIEPEAIDRYIERRRRPAAAG